MITPLDSYFAYQAERPRSRAEQLAEDARAAELAASLNRGQAVLAGIGRRLRLPRYAPTVARTSIEP